jgi:hypothetical protein
MATSVFIATNGIKKNYGYCKAAVIESAFTNAPSQGFMKKQMQCSAKAADGRTARS